VGKGSIVLLQKRGLSLEYLLVFLRSSSSKLVIRKCPEICCFGLKTVVQVVRFRTKRSKLTSQVWGGYIKTEMGDYSWH
jgi:hypothetical protein